MMGCRALQKVLEGATLLLDGDTWTLKGGAFMLLKRGALILDVHAAILEMCTLIRGPNTAHGGGTLFDA